MVPTGFTEAISYNKVVHDEARYYPDLEEMLPSPLKVH